MDAVPDGLFLIWSTMHILTQLFLCTEARFNTDVSMCSHILFHIT
jgi:hypothetical protein